MPSTDSRRPGVRKRKTWMEVEKRGRETKKCGEREKEREGGIKAFSLVSIHSVRPLPPTSLPERWKDEAREEASS